MSSVKYKDFVVSLDGWLVIIFVLFPVYLAYYLVFYPFIVKEMQYINVQLTQEAQTSLTQDFSLGEEPNDHLVQVSFRTAQYLTNFQEGEVIVVVENNTSQRVQGCLYLEGVLKKSGKKGNYGEAQFPISSQYTLEVGLSSGEASTYAIPVYVDSADADQIEFRIYYFPGIVYADGSCFIDPGKQSGYRRNLSWASTNNVCESTSNTAEYVCVSIDAWNGFVQSAMRRLLLPPWSNRILPFVVVALAWLTEQLLEPIYQRNKVGFASPWWRIWLTLLVTILLVLFAYSYVVLILWLGSENRIILVLIVALIPLTVYSVIRFFAEQKYSQENANVFDAEYRLDLEELEKMYTQASSDVQKSEISKSIHKVKEELQDDLDTILEKIESKEDREAFQRAEKLDRKAVRVLLDLNGDLEKRHVPVDYGYYDDIKRRWYLSSNTAVLKIVVWMVNSHGDTQETAKI